VPNKQPSQNIGFSVGNYTPKSLSKDIDALEDFTFIFSETKPINITLWNVEFYGFIVSLEQFEATNSISISTTRNDELFSVFGLLLIAERILAKIIRLGGKLVK